MEYIDFGNREEARVKQGVYTICFVLLCIIDMLMGSATGRVQMTVSNCTGLILGVITLTGYKWKDFFRWPYLVWAALGGFGTYQAITWGLVNKNYKGQWISAVLVVFLYGFIILRLLSRILIEKKYPKMNWYYFLFWFVLMLGMVFSKNDAMWPVLFLVCFGCFYLTDFSKEDRNALFSGLLNGIIIGFVIIQGFATMFRAYDEVRYVGMYINSNMNALFYLMVHTAILCKWYQFKRNNAAIGWSIFAGVGSCILFCYGLLTIGRTAVFCMAIDTVLFICISQFVDKSRKFWYLKILVKLAGIVVVTGLSLPVVFSVTRYIPAHFYSPLTVFFEKDLEYKIHESTDFYDERYMDWDYFLEESFGRFDLLFQPAAGGAVDLNSAFAGGLNAIGEKLFPTLKAYAGDADNDMITIVKTRSWGTGESDDMPVLQDERDWENSYMIRMGIYRTYLSKMNFEGHPASDDGVWVTTHYYAPHAHDVFIQMSFSHGVVVGILFILDILFLLFCSGKNLFGKRKKEWGYMVSFLFVFAFVGFSLFEIAWKLGQLSFFMLFLAHYLVMKKEENADEETEMVYCEVSDDVQDDFEEIN